MFSNTYYSSVEMSSDLGGSSLTLQKIFCTFARSLPSTWRFERGLKVLYFQGRSISHLVKYLANKELLLPRSCQANCIPGTAQSTLNPLLITLQHYQLIALCRKGLNGV